MTSVDTYQALETWVPGIIAGILMLLSFIAVMVVSCKYGYVPKFFVEVMQLYFPDLKVKKNNEEVKVDDINLNPAAVFFLALIVLTLTLGTMFLTFWSVYLVEEDVRGDCVPNFECFPMHRGNYLQTTPVDNCSQLFDLSHSNMTSMGFDNFTDTVNETDIGDGAMEIRYECYRFVFRYIEGFSAAGGVLLFTAVLSKLYFGILTAIYDSEIADIWKVVLTVATWSFAGFFCLLFIVFNTAWPLVREAVFQTTADIILFSLYSLNFVAIVACGVVVSCGICWSDK